MRKNNPIGRKEEEMRVYRLIPVNGQKSFYGKAIVRVQDDGAETLYSYDAPIIERQPNGKLIKLYDGWTQTTGRHIKAFCGLSKEEYIKL